MSNSLVIVPRFIDDESDPPDGVKYNLVDDLLPNNSNTVDTKYNPLTLKSLFDILHSLMRNPFYEPLFEVILNELQQSLEKMYTLEILYDTDTYLGDAEEYSQRINNLAKRLGLPIPITFLNIIQSNYVGEDNIYGDLTTFPIYLKNKWFRDYLRSSFVMRKWFGSIKGYEYIIKSAYRKGSASLVTKYVESEGFSEITDKIFKITDFFGKIDRQANNSFLPLLPDSFSSIWPMITGVSGLQDTFDLNYKIYRKYDSNFIYDAGEVSDKDTIVNARYDDNPLEIGFNYLGIDLELYIDSVLTHKNTIKTNECLMDTPYLDYINILFPKVRKISEPVFIGTQISLVANNLGTYVTDSSSSIQKLGDEFYTHPNIKAKFQVIKSNYENNSVPGLMRIGDGAYTTEVFALTPAEIPVTPPTNIQNPLFESPIGQFEYNTLNSYTTITIMFLRQQFKEKDIVGTTYDIGGTLNEFPPELIIELPHGKIAPGTVQLDIKLPFETFGTETEYQTIRITEKWNQSLQSYEPYLQFFDGKMAIASAEETNDSDYVEPETYAKDYMYLPTNSSIFVVVSDISIDHTTGTVTLKIKSNPLADQLKTLYKNDGIITIGGTTTCSYDTNSIRSENVNFVKITEVGVFNTENQLIAYGTFPPIIYDPKKFHLTVNCLLEKPIFN